MKTRRQLRMEERVKRLLGELLRDGIRDPRVGLISVMGVELTADLKQARVYVSVLGGQADDREVLEGLDGARGWLQRELGAGLGSRYTPVLRFFIDHSIVQQARISGILEDLREKGDWSPDEDED